MSVTFIGQRTKLVFISISNDFCTLQNARIFFSLTKKPKAIQKTEQASKRTSQKLGVHSSRKMSTTRPEAFNDRAIDRRCWGYQGAKDTEFLRISWSALIRCFSMPLYLWSRPKSTQLLTANTAPCACSILEKSFTREWIDDIFALLFSWPLPLPSIPFFPFSPNRVSGWPWTFDPLLWFLLC